MTDEIIVRVGAPDDLIKVMQLAMLVAHENAPGVPSHLKIRQAVWDALNKHYGMIGIVGPKGTDDVHGFVLLKIHQPWYSDERVIEECGTYVHPDWRKARTVAISSGADRAAGKAPGRAAMLYRFCKRVADEMNCKLVIGVMSRHRLESKLRYYERFFGERAGAFFVYDPTQEAQKRMLSDLYTADKQGRIVRRFAGKGI